jgi:hypothetical protein
MYDHLLQVNSVLVLLKRKLHRVDFLNNGMIIAGQALYLGCYIVVLFR